MSQPTDFIDKDKPTYVCKLKKAIHGLRQALREWYVELSSFPLKFGFTNSTSDAYLFIYQNNGITMYFLVFVDDLVLTGNKSEELANFFDKLSAQFSLKDFDRLLYFLGIEVVFTSSGLLLTQQKYVRKILEKYPEATDLCISYQPNMLVSSCH